jgi:hypothetical protein
MHPQRRRQASVPCSLLSFLILLALGCTPSVKGARQPAAPLMLVNPTSVTSAIVSLAVGSNRLRTQDTSVEGAFLPVAVTVRNRGDHMLCGGAHTAVLGDSSGASVSATLPEGVVTRLFGPLASLGPMSRPAAGMGTFSDQPVSLVLVQGSHGGFSGGIGRGSGGFPGGASRPYLNPSPRVLVPPLFPSPFYSPYSPFGPSPFSPFYRPFPPLSPYGYAPYEYGYPPLPPALPPDLRLPEENSPTLDSSLIKEILSTAFASRPLAPQEERSWFLFFALPVPNGEATMLTWDWYDCATRELVVHLSISVSVEKKV